MWIWQEMLPKNSWDTKLNIFYVPDLFVCNIKNNITPYYLPFRFISFILLLDFTLFTIKTNQIQQEQEGKPQSFLLLFIGKALKTVNIWRSTISCRVGMEEWMSSCYLCWENSHNWRSLYWVIEARHTKK